MKSRYGHPGRYAGLSGWYKGAMTSRVRRAVERNAWLRRLYILSVTYRDHRFERRSPIPLLSDREIRGVFNADLVFPPRSDLLHPGMQTVEGLFALGALATYRPVRTVFEIGTFRGVTAWFLGRNCSGAEVFTLDIPPDAAPALPTESSDEFRAERDRMYYEARPGAANVTQLWGDSARFDFSPWYGRCDLVYIDGAHSEEYVRSDTDSAMKMLADDGVIVWDDYWKESPGTTKVLNELHAQGLALRRPPRTRLVAYAKKGF